MKTLMIGLLSAVMCSGCVAKQAQDPMEQDAAEQRAREFLAETAPREMNGHPKAVDNLMDRTVNRSADNPNDVPGNPDPKNEYLNETE